MLFLGAARWEGRGIGVGALCGTAHACHYCCCHCLPKFVFFLWPVYNPVVPVGSSRQGPALYIGSVAWKAQWTHVPTVSLKRTWVCRVP